MKHIAAIGHRHLDGSLHARLADGSERVLWTNRTPAPPSYGADSPACDCPHCRWSRRQPKPTGH